ncbi:hypothetical protein [Parasediminibacterium sp. JCM 36343]|uniref:hypothetical protein n=1 Tax=Parasediminibacterium sp. JCM 36343 TaxID=3374279 RepID=UPI00397AF469
MIKLFICLVLLLGTICTAYAQGIYMQNDSANNLDVTIEQAKGQRLEKQATAYICELPPLKVESKIKVQKLEVKAPASILNDNDDNDKSGKEAQRGLKIDLYGPFRGYTQISYEVVTQEGRGYELSLGLIGVGTDKLMEYSDTSSRFSTTRKNQIGLFLAVGYKFSKLPILLFGHTQPTHILQGAYAKPTLYVGRYSENRVAFKGNNVYQLEKPNTTFACLQMEFGKQWVIANKGLIDFYWGLGYGIDNKTYYSTSYFEYITTSAFNYCNDRIGRSPGISFTFGIKLGLLIK